MTVHTSWSKTLFSINYVILSVSIYIPFQRNELVFIVQDCTARKSWKITHKEYFLSSGVPRQKNSNTQRGNVTLCMPRSKMSSLGKQRLPVFPAQSTVLSRRPAKFGSERQMSRVLPSDKNTIFHTAYEHFDVSTLQGTIYRRRMSTVSR